MAFFEEIGKKIAKSGSDAAQKAKNLAETVRLNGLISDEEKRIKNSHSQIGKLYYDNFNENPDQSFVQFIAEINDAKAKIQKYSEQVKQIKGVTTCEKCGGEVSYTAPFCSACGSPMNVAPPIQPSGNTCTNCNGPLAENQLFCTGCGTKVEHMQVQTSAGTIPPVLPQCSSCGYELATDAVFCLNCGTKAAS